MVIRQNPKQTPPQQAIFISQAIPIYAQKQQKRWDTVKLCSTVDSKEKNLALEKAREYRKRNIKLKDRAGRFSISQTKRNKLQYAVGNVVLMAAPL